MLPYEWTLKGSTQALPRIQQIFKRWDGGRVTLTAASQVANTSSSHQKLDFNHLVDAFHKFVPYAGDKTWKENYMPVLRNCREQFKDRPPVDGEALCMSALAQGHKDAANQPQSAFQVLGLGGSTWSPESHLQPTRSIA